MAKPQAEKGHIYIPNEIVEALAHIRISGEENQCLWVILRETYGCHKKERTVSLSLFSDITCLKRHNAARALWKLLSKNMISVIKNSRVNTYIFNKDYDKWKTQEENGQKTSSPNKENQGE